ncbi:MAG: hypothetical protein K0S68_78 [Candidatus Saccharibacteria bacterium]|jgi:hypothetical protein|nr:hypothetical protein [Candidatus Saccharibacteria bacterium]
MLESLRRYRLYLAITTGVLFLSFAFNVFGAVTTLGFNENFKDSESLVTNQVLCEGRYHHGQLLSFKDEKTPATTRVGCEPQKLKPYSSHFGLQGRVLVVAAAVTGIKETTFIKLATLATALVSALVLALTGLWVRRRYGLIPAVTFTALIAISPMVVGFGRNLYWAMPLMFASLAYTLWFYRPQAARKRAVWFWSGLGVLFYLRYLCGYEYVTSFTLMVAAAIAYHLYMGRAQRKSYLREFSLLLATAVLSFSLAIGTHVLALSTDTGSVSKAVETIKQRAVARTADAGPAAPIAIDGLRRNVKEVYHAATAYADLDAKAQSGSMPWAVIAAGANYLFLPVVRFPLALTEPFATYSQSFAALLLALAALFHFRQHWAAGLRREVDALFVAMGVGLAAMLSWLILAPSHSLVHAHINGILIYLPFAIFGYAAIGVAVQTLIRRLR